MTRARTVCVCASLVACAGAAHAREAELYPAVDPVVEKAGEVLSLSGEAADILVQRQGNIIMLSQGAELIDGDKIMTGETGYVTVSANGCERALSPMSLAIVGADFCRTAVSELVEQSEGAADLPVAPEQVLAAPASSGPAIVESIGVPSGLLISAGVVSTAIALASSGQDSGRDTPISR